MQMPRFRAGHLVLNTLKLNTLEIGSVPVDLLI